MYQKKIAGVGIDGIAKYAQILPRILSRFRSVCSVSVIHFFGDGIVSACKLLMCIINRRTTYWHVLRQLFHEKASVLHSLSKFLLNKNTENDEFHFKFKTTKNYFTNTLTIRLKWNRGFMLVVRLIIVVWNGCLFFKTV